MEGAKKVLLVPYYWPPSGGAGVQRWLKLSHYLAELGVEVHVLTVDPAYASYMQTDESLLEDVDPRVTVHHTKSFEPINYYGKLVGKSKIPTNGFSNVDESNWKQQLVITLRSHLFIPDPRRGWKPFAVRAAKKIIKLHGIETVITTSTPQSVHLIGLALQRSLGIRWIADFRDPWTDIYFYNLLRHSRLSAAIDKRIELKVLRKADQLITAWQGIKTLFLQHVPERNPNDILVIPNGYDDRDFAGPIGIPPFTAFTIAYTGSISDQYEPEPFLEALANAIQRRKEIKVQLLLVGHASEGIRATIAEKGIPLLDIGPVPHAEVNDYQRRADALLLVAPKMKGGKGILPGKLFEYMAAQRPILSLGMPGADVQGILEKTGTGRHFDGGEVAQMTNYLIQLIDGEHRCSFNEAEIAAYSRQRQAEQVMALI
ncbi:glycosyltransferase family 4 protein [Neolewinella persica]|uniref:glycosyltransferase family 4 protein n=1 Tax=Neolewinella persica TaxID=70998 RepID=UPI000380EC11|nr:glycosyltransferase family 4 protein [Neolewinella persica]